MTKIQHSKYSRFGNWNLFRSIRAIRNLFRKLRLRTWIALGLIVILAPIIIFTLYRPNEPSAEWWDEMWKHRKKITIDADQIPGSSNLTDYPVMIQIADDTDISDAAQSDGDDIVFTDLNGAKLDHEIEDYAEDGSGADLTAWVRIPSLSPTIDTEIYMYYGNPTAANQENVNEVWDENYVMVQHLEETTTGSTDFRDSTRYGNNSSSVTIDGTGSDPDATGKADGAVQFDGSNDVIHIGPDNSSLEPPDDMTLEAWYNFDTLPSGLGKDADALGKWGTTGGIYSYYFTFRSADDKPQFRWAGGGTSVWVQSSASALSAGSWYYIVGRRSGSDFKLFQNASDVTASTYTLSGTLRDSNDTIRVGSLDGFYNHMDGYMDEIRLSKSARSSDWITTTYNNINSPGTFFSVDSEETTTGPVGYWKLDEGQGSTAYDSTEQGNDGTITGGTWQPEEACVYDKCLYLDGTDDVISVSNTVSDIKTVSFWARVPSTSTTEQLLDLNGTDYISSVSGTITVNGFGTETIYVDGVAGSTISADRWHHIAVTTSTGISGSAIKIGQISTNYGQAFIDEVKVYPYARSADEIKVDYNRGAAVMGVSTQEYLTNGLVGYWKLDETSAGSSQVDRLDSSGNGVTLTDNGTTASAGGKFGLGSEHVPANTEYLSTASTISGVRSVSFWVNPDSNTNYYISLTSSAYITSSSGTLTATGFSNPTIYVNGAESTSISANVWSLVTVTDTTSIDADQFYVGRQGSNYFDGTMDEVRLYNRVLSSDEVRWLYEWAPGPVAFWKLDENTGTSAYDSSGNGNSGTLYPGSGNVPAWVPGKYGSALKFDGTDDYVSITDSSSISPTGSMTLSVWVKNFTESSGNIVAKWDGLAGKRSYQLYGGDVSPPRPMFRISSDGSSGNMSTIQSTQNINDSYWHHIVAIYDSAAQTLDMYLDGIPAATQVTGVQSSIYDSDGNLTIGVELSSGSPAGGSYGNGIIDDVRIYDYVRTPEQIVEDMNAGHPTGGGPIGSQVARWKFDDMNSASAQDSGPNGQDLTLVNTPTWTSSGKLEGALSFASASSEYGYAADSADLSITGSLTLSAWIKPSSNTASTFYDIAGKWDGANESYLLTQYGDEIRFYIDSNSGYIETTTANLATGTWYHVAGVYDSILQTMKIYIDGVEQSTTSTTVPSSIGDDGGRFHVGASHSTGGSPSNFYNGVIDEVHLYNSALSASQISIDYNFGSAVNYSSGSEEADDLGDGAGDPPVSYFPLDENTGTTSTYDKSGTARTGTLTNIESTDWVPGVYGSALKLDGTNEYVDIGTGPGSVNSITFWVKPATTTEYFINLTSNTDYIWSNAGTVTASGLSAPTIYVDGVQTTTITANTWHHVAIVTSTSENASNFDIGRTQDTNYLEGEIDEVKLFDYALTRAQVAYEYNRGRPVGHWKLDECQGTTAYDTSGNGKNGTISLGATAAGTCTGAAGEAWYEGASGKINASLRFDGSDDYVYVTNDSVHNMGSGDFTLSAWFKTSTTSTGNIVGKGSTYTTGKRYQININDTGDCASGKIKVEIDDDSTKEFVCSTSSSLNNNSWHHVVMVRDGNDLRLFIDGAEDANSPNDITGYGNIDSSRDFYIGAIYQEGLGIADHYSGLVDDVRLYNYALSATQVRKVYNTGAAVRFW